VDLDVEYATTLVAAVLLGVGFVLQQFAAEQEPESRFLHLRILTDLLRKPRWLLGIGCMVAGYLCAAWSIGHLELTLVEPLLTTYLVWALILAVPLSRQPVRATEVVGALILCGGVALLSASRSITPIGLSFGSFSHWYAAAIIAGIAFVSVQVGHRRTGQVRATLTGLAAGLVFGIQDALTRQTLEIMQGNGFGAVFSAWAPYALVGAGIVGIWLMQNAFSAAPLHASLPAIAAGEPLAGIALGIVVFGDRIQITPGMLAIQAGGIAALIVGVIAVARSSAFSGLRKLTDHIRPGSESSPPSPPDAPGGRTPPEPGRTPPYGTAEPRSPGGSADGHLQAASADGHLPAASADGHLPAVSADGHLPAATADVQVPGGPDPRSPRKFSRPAHQRQVHDSASGGEGC
jgi:drug/metabolite transporter (DMT)-like permease